MSQNQNASSGIPPRGDSAPTGAQPRQPHNLQGLLKFAMEATKQEDVSSDGEPLTIDEERRKFLENALKSMTVDIIETLENCVNVLLNADQLKETDDLSQYLEAFTKILDHVDVLDTAVDFHKIGGFRIFPPCLASSVAQIRAQACVVIGECTQNNPYCQEVVLDTDLLEQLLSILDKDSDLKVKTKALFAISCTVRENPEALKLFTQLKGLQIVINALKGPEFLSGKAAFLLGRLSIKNNSVRDQLISLNILPTLCELLTKERNSSHEHLLALMWNLVDNNPKGLKICKQPELELKKILTNHLKIINLDEDYEEKDFCDNILMIMNH